MHGRGMLRETHRPMRSLCLGSLLSRCCTLSTAARQLNLMSSTADLVAVGANTDMLRLRSKRAVSSTLYLQQFH